MSKFQEDYKNYLYHSGFITEDELIHYGVPGMKWGVRKAQSKNYEDSAVKRDRALYGDKAVRRINKYMLKGDDYMTARHKMGNREYKKGRLQNIAGKIAVPAGVGLGIGSALLSNKLRRMSDYGRGKYVDLLNEGGRDASNGRIWKLFGAMDNASKGAKLAGYLAPFLGAAGSVALTRSGNRKRYKYRSYK